MRAFLRSIAYPATLAFLVFLIWCFPAAWNWVFVVFYLLLAFLPLLGEDGRGYLPLLLLPPLSIRSNVSFQSLPVSVLVMEGAVLVSMILFLFLRHCRFRRGDLLVSLAVLFLLFLISYIVRSAMDGTADTTAILYLLSLFSALVPYVLLSTTLGKGETFPYLTRTIVVFSCLIVLQVFLYLVKHGFGIVGEDFSLGWSYTVQTASTLLCFSLPFYALLVSQRKYWAFVPEILVYVAIIFLSADSGLLALILSTVPLILVSFRNYGKWYPYLTLTFLIVVGMTFSLLLAFNPLFNKRVVLAFQSLALSNEPAEWRKDLFDAAVRDFLSFPTLGPSLTSFSRENGTLVLASNTVLSTMVMGGSFGLLAYAVYEFRLYQAVFRKKIPERKFFLLYLLILELIGLTDNTLYNLIVLFFVLVTNACYQCSNRPEDVKIHVDPYLNRREDGLRAPATYLSSTSGKEGRGKGYGR